MRYKKSALPRLIKGCGFHLSFRILTDNHFVIHNFSYCGAVGTREEISINNIAANEKNENR